MHENAKFVEKMSIFENLFSVSRIFPKMFLNNKYTGGSEKQINSHSLR